MEVTPSFSLLAAFIVSFCSGPAMLALANKSISSGRLSGLALVTNITNASLI